MSGTPTTYASGFFPPNKTRLILRTANSSRHWSSSPRLALRASAHAEGALVFSKDFPPFTTVQNYFLVETRMEVILRSLRRAARLDAGRAEEPTASERQDHRERRAARFKKVKGRKRQIRKGTRFAASIQDRDGAPDVLEEAVACCPTLQALFADGGTRGRNVRPWPGQLDLIIVSKPPGSKGFAVLPRRWVVERTLAWLNRCRRLAKDFDEPSERQGVGALGCGAALGPPPRAARKCLCNNGLNGLAKVLIQTLMLMIRACESSSSPASIGLVQLTSN